MQFFGLKDKEQQAKEEQPIFTTTALEKCQLEMR